MTKATSQEFIHMRPDGVVLSIFPKGRDAWALSNLIAAGKTGCTPITHVGPRWSSYVHKLRKVYGLNIETRHEAHDGPFPGTHARYVLHSEVFPASQEVA